MSKIIKAAFSPVVLIMVAALVVGVGVATGHILPVAHAQLAAIDCPVINDQVVCDQPQQDVCWNLQGAQAEVPSGYHIDESQDNACIEDPAPQVLGESTTVSDPGPQVLAESTFGK